MKRKTLTEATAPYNFVSFPNKLIERYTSITQLPQHDKFYTDRYNGTIEYTIEAKTPILVASGMKQKNNDTTFFKNLNGEYAIPGSTIRGLIKTNAGILSLSSFSEEIQNQLFLYRGLADKYKKLRKEYEKKIDISNMNKTPGKVKAGYITLVGKDEYVIHPAKDIDGKTFYRVTEMTLRKMNLNNLNINYMYSKDIINFTPGNRKNKEKQKEEWFAFIEKKQNRYKYKPYSTKISFDLKRMKDNISVKNISLPSKLKYKGYLLCSGFMQKKLTHYVINEKDENKQVIKLNKEQIRAYKQDLIRKKMDKNEFYKLPENIGEEKPIFYADGDNYTYFGYTPYLRIAYDGNIRDGIPQHLKQEELKIDYSKAIFGFTTNEKSYKSRISFEDAIILGKAKLVNRETIVLMEPKATCFPHYLEQSTKDKNQLTNYNDKGSFRLRGVKQYWLKDAILPNKADHNNHIVHIVPLDKGSKFKGKIHFNNLSKDELGLLLWAISLEEGMYQNIGLGKPYGYGQVCIGNIELYVEDINKKYTSFSFGFMDKRDIEEFIESYKKYVKEQYQIDIEGLRSTQDLFIMKKNILSNEKTRYMTLEEFAQRTVLPTPKELIENIIENNSRLVGTIVKFFHERGYGFIRPEGSKEKVFVHISALKHNVHVEEGERVKFTVIRNEKGLQAKSVEKY